MNSSDRNAKGLLRQSLLAPLQLFSGFWAPMSSLTGRTSTSPATRPETTSRPYVTSVRRLHGYLQWVKHFRVDYEPRPGTALNLLRNPNYARWQRRAKTISSRREGDRQTRRNLELSRIPEFSGLDRRIQGLKTSQFPHGISFCL